MKKLILISAVLQFLIFTIAFPQKDWVKLEGNPVLEPGQTGSWDDESTDLGCVLFDGTIYHMWYAGFDGVHYRIGHATSHDGIVWTKDPQNPVLDVGDPGTWEESLVYMPTIILKDAVFHMYYDGAWGWIEKIGHATSNDGTNWTKDPNNPVLDIGASGSWDDTQVFPMAGSVIYDEDKFKMWFGGCNSSNHWQIGYATSNDGFVWTKENANNPVMGPGSAEEWDSHSVIPGTVRWDGGQYTIWYSGCTTSNRWRVGYATSPDGINWAKYLCNPALDFGDAGSWDFQQAWDASVIYDSITQNYMMWYTGGPFNEGRMGFATSRSSQIIRVPCDYLTIQEGIDAASNGDTVLVAEGTYYENVRFIGKAITLGSEYIMDGDPDHITNTIINGSQPANSDSAACVMFVNSEDTSSILNGFTITEGSGVYRTDWQVRSGGGIYATSASAKIVNNYIVYNEVVGDRAGGAGISFFGEGSNNLAVIDNNTVSHNTSISNGFSAYAGGISLLVSGVIKNNIIEYNTCINDTEMADGGGIEIETYFNDPLQYVYIHNNVIRHNTLDGITSAIGAGIMSLGVSCNLSNNIITNNQANAVDFSSGGGFYFNEARDSIVVIHNNIVNNNSCASLNTWGGGARVRTCKTPYITDNEFNNNILDGEELAIGGGLVINRPVENAIISGNEFVNNNISNGNTYGGGFSIYKADTIPVMFDKNLVADNYAGNAGGIYSRNSYNTTISNNVISENLGAGQGGGIRFWHWVKKDDSENSTDREEISAIPLSPKGNKFNPLVINNTFFDNTSTSGGGIFSNHPSEIPILLNTLFWKNSAPHANDVYIDGGAMMNIEFCNIDSLEITGNWTGIGNITEDPLFSDTNCHISGGPCHNAGIDEIEIGGVTYYAPEKDYDGNWRPQGPSWDIGADECLMVGISQFTEPESDFSLKINPNPTSGFINISYTFNDDMSFALSILNVRGELLDSYNYNHQISGEQSLKLDLSYLPNGIYFIRLQAGNQVETTKVVLLK